MSLLDQLNELRERASAELAGVPNAEALESFRIKYLGRKGTLTALMAEVGKQPAELKPQAGRLANQVKGGVQAAFQQRKKELTAATEQKPVRFDVTEPGIAPQLGRKHILTQTIDELLEIFGRMGFDVAYGPEVEDEFHNFVALNIPQEHPARDPLDNFYLSDKVLLRSQTSTVQIRVMEKQKPPIRVVAPGRVYRPDTVDATHSCVFHQIEGLYVDQGVSMCDLKTCLDQFAHAYFGPQVKTRFRPSFFPFTEPSAELDIYYTFKDGRQDWMELGGCGMVDPAVFEAVGIDPETYTGFAFGMGVERMAMQKYGIPDIRLFYENDLRFLSQF